MPGNIAELERRARQPSAPEVYDYYAGGPGASGCRGPLPVPGTAG
jgi:hypothetical protein